jgi:flagellar biosynthesis/type III secretory pathway protein FliH
MARAKASPKRTPKSSGVRGVTKPIPKKEPTGSFITWRRRQRDLIAAATPAQRKAYKKAAKKANAANAAALARQKGLQKDRELRGSIHS